MGNRRFFPLAIIFFVFFVGGGGRGGEWKWKNFGRLHGARGGG